MQQNFTGLYEGRENTNGKELKFETFLEGNLPSLEQDEQVIYVDFNQDYQYSSVVENPNDRKLIENRCSILYKTSTIRDQNSFRSYRIEHSERIHFSVCDGLNSQKQVKKSEQSSIRNGS